ncbi:MAG: leucine-rich repeat domain-containing protein, partial [Clostridia bacterium]|nr:leucine-rich repeat domain-containing protein [Clostridia bacterium]
MNFKKTLAIIMSATMVFSPAVSVYAYDTETDNGAIEMYEPAKAQASSGTCGEKLTWTLDGNGKLTISGKGAIYDGAFSSMYDFEDSSVIRSVVIGTGVTGIGASAFEYCSSLESVTIPSSVTYIADYAFYECSSLKSITIPASVSSIGDDVFSMCSTLTEIKVNANNNYYSSDETGALFDKNKTVLIQYPVGNSSASYDFPAGVKSINAWAFSYCSNIESVTFSDALTSIGDYAFYECSGLKSVVIPGNVQKIGDSAFEYCPSLSSVSISDSVTSIGYGAF